MSQQVAKQHTQKQRSLRNHVKGQELEAAVAYAVRSMFRFTHRAKEGKATLVRFSCRLARSLDISALVP